MRGRHELWLSSWFPARVVSSACQGLVNAGHIVAGVCCSVLVRGVPHNDNKIRHLWPANYLLSLQKFMVAICLWKKENHQWPLPWVFWGVFTRLHACIACSVFPLASLCEDCQVSWYPNCSLFDCHPDDLRRGKDSWSLQVLNCQGVCCASSCSLNGGHQTSRGQRGTLTVLLGCPVLISGILRPVQDETA